MNYGRRLDEFGAASRGPFNGPPEQWAEELAELALDYGMTGFILAADDAYSIELFASEVGPATLRQWIEWSDTWLKLPRPAGADARHLCAASPARFGCSSQPRSEVRSSCSPRRSPPLSG